MLRLQTEQKYGKDCKLNKNTPDQEIKIVFWLSWYILDESILCKYQSKLNSDLIYMVCTLSAWKLNWHLLMITI